MIEQLVASSFLKLFALNSFQLVPATIEDAFLDEYHHKWKPLTFICVVSYVGSFLIYAENFWEADLVTAKVVH